jgi:hypothetical protein
MADIGFENFALISLFTRVGWAGNKLLIDPIGSDFEEVCHGPITKSLLNDVRDSAERALKSSIFGKVSVAVSNPSGDRLNVRISLSPPGSNVQAIMLTRYGGNWQYQAEVC